VRFRARTAYLPTLQVGAECLPTGGVQFRVWAPFCRNMAVRVVGSSPEKPAEMTPVGDGWFEVTLETLRPGTRYFYVLDGQRDRPDPASRAQPEGVHGPSEIVDTRAFVWTDDAWRGLAMRSMAIYELHVGTFTFNGTSDAVIPRLERLRDLGITAIELMPVASFPGLRNWGYDGVGLFAPQRTYGGPAGLQRLVDACHAVGLAVILDVVYNHLGPEGNYLGEFGPYYTDRYRTPWGQAINFDGDGSRNVRDFFIANALYWIREYHIDGLRLDAIHGIFDSSPMHILRELNEAVQALARRLGRIVSAIAESDLNDRRVVDPVHRGGYGLAGQWTDDLHHSLHTLLTRERKGYYADFGALHHLGKAYTHGFVYDGQHSLFRGMAHGTTSRDVPAEAFIVCAQNHDQIGNRALGERLSSLVNFEALKLAASAVLFSPYVPLFFMGEEYGEEAPFLFFTDFEDPALREAVSRGRREEFAAFGWAEKMLDPQDPSSFARSKLNWNLQTREPHVFLWRYYQTLLALRRDHQVLGAGGKRYLVAREVGPQTLLIHRRGPKGVAAFSVLHFGQEDSTLRLRIPPGPWRRIVDSAEKRFGGRGTKSPVLLPFRRTTWVEVEIARYGALLYLREGGAKTLPSAKASENVTRIEPPAEPELVQV